jgi:hypothetical protein
MRKHHESGWRAATVLLLVTAGACLAAAATKGEPRVPVIYNLDCSEMFMGKFGPPLPETLDKFVDDHAEAGVTDLFINVNAQRVNYRSAVWEAFWDGYDPKLGPEQPFFDGIEPRRRAGPDADDTKFYIGTYQIYKAGCDYPQRLIDRARRNGVRPWISFRMNDGEEGGTENHPIHSTFWRAHPEWRLAYGMDYEQPEVREYYMKLIKEVCSRYDVAGLELDYLRFWLYFRAGREHAGATLMTAFVTEAREATRAAAKRWKHPVKLAVRVPSTPWIARQHGLEPVAWAKAGLVDLIIVSPFWPSINGDMPIETWKGMLLGTNVPVAFGLEGGLNAGSGIRAATPEEMQGAMLSGLQRGADAVYFFNLFTLPYVYWPREAYRGVLRDASSYSTLCSVPRSHPLTITWPWAVGEPGMTSTLTHYSPLPYSGANGVFRLHVGPRPTETQHAAVELVTADDNQRPEVRVNGIPCPWSRLLEPERFTTSKWPSAQPKRQMYDVSAQILADGYNLIEVDAKEPVTVTWVEISVRP